LALEMRTTLGIWRIPKMKNAQNQERSKSRMPKMKNQLKMTKIKNTLKMTKIKNAQN